MSRTDMEAGVSRTEQAGLWNIANVLTMLRIVLVPFFGYFLIARGGHDTAFRVTAFVIFFLASVTDRVDGQLARSRGLETDFGRLMDPIADKALMGMAFIGLSVIDLVPWWLSIVVLAREVLITGLRFVIIHHGVMPASKGGKLKTALQALAAGLFVLPLPHWAHLCAWGVMIAAVVVTVVTGVEYFFRAAQLRARSKRLQAGAGRIGE